MKERIEIHDISYIKISHETKCDIALQVKLALTCE